MKNAYAAGELRISFDYKRKGWTEERVRAYLEHLAKTDRQKLVRILLGSPASYVSSPFKLEIGASGGYEDVS